MSDLHGLRQSPAGRATSRPTHNSYQQVREDRWQPRMREALGCPDTATAGVLVEDYRSALARGRCASSPLRRRGPRAARRAQEREQLVARQPGRVEPERTRPFRRCRQSRPHRWCARGGAPRLVCRPARVAGAGAQPTAGCRPQRGAAHGGSEAHSRAQPRRVAHSGVRGAGEGYGRGCRDVLGVHTSTTSTGESPALTPALQSFSDNFPLLQSWGSSSPR